MNYLNNKIDLVYIFNFDPSTIENAILRFRCSLKSIVNQNVNICVSNNSSVCIYDKIIDIVPNLRYIHTPYNGSFSRALGINYAVKTLVTSEYFIVSDIDLVYSKDHIQRLFLKFISLRRDGENIRFVTYNYNLLPVVHFSNLRRKIRRYLPFAKFLMNLDEKEIPHVYSHDYEVLDQLPRSNGGYAHGNGIIHKDSFIQIKGYDEEMIGYGPEDDLFNTRISKVNRIVYDNLPDTASFHLWHPRFHMIQFEKNMDIWHNRKLYYNSLVNPSYKDVVANSNKKEWGVI